eukprot:scaffold13782_cov26-Tisochrysis_lutea.AAC.5
MRSPAHLPTTLPPLGARANALQRACLQGTAPPRLVDALCNRAPAGGGKAAGSAQGMWPPSCLPGRPCARNLCGRSDRAAARDAGVRHLQVDILRLQVKDCARVPPEPVEGPEQPALRAPRRLPRAIPRRAQHVPHLRAIRYSTRDAANALASYTGRAARLLSTPLRALALS